MVGTCDLSASCNGNKCHSNTGTAEYIYHSKALHLFQTICYKCEYFYHFIISLSVCIRADILLFIVAFIPSTEKR